jgi:hypothetical protein
VTDHGGHTDVMLRRVPPGRVCRTRRPRRHTAASPCLAPARGLREPNAATYPQRVGFGLLDRHRPAAREPPQLPLGRLCPSLCGPSIGVVTLGEGRVSVPGASVKTCLSRPSNGFARRSIPRPCRTRIGARWRRSWAAKRQAPNGRLQRRRATNRSRGPTVNRVSCPRVR